MRDQDIPDCSTCPLRAEHVAPTQHGAEELALRLWRAWEVTKQTSAPWLVLACYMGRMSYDQIGAELGLTKSGAQRRIERAMKAARCG